GRYRGAGSGERFVTVTGRRGGREERFSTAARFGGEQAGPDYVQQLWAARKAGALASDLRLHGPNPEIVSELKRLALRYGILTEYTSYLVQEPGVVAQRPDVNLRMAPRDQAGAEAVQRSRAEQALSGSLQLSAVVVTGSAADSVGVPGDDTNAKHLVQCPRTWPRSTAPRTAHSCGSCTARCGTPSVRRTWPRRPLLGP